MTAATAATSTGLDFFVDSELAYQRVLGCATCHVGESTLKPLRESLSRDLACVHDLPLSRLNNCLKRYPFVNPGPLDFHLAEIFDSMRTWLEWLTSPDWIEQVTSQVARKSEEHAQLLVEDPAAMLDLELEQLGRFVYPVPLKLRDLQAMIRPFMEARSTHHISGLDAIVGELINGLLRVYHVVRAWDDTLIDSIKAMAEADLANDRAARCSTLLDICAICNMDVFDAAHRLARVDTEVFRLSRAEVGVILQKLPLATKQRILTGPPAMTLDMDSYGSSASVVDRSGGRKNRRLSVISMFPDMDQGPGGDERVFTSLERIRLDCLSWWQQHRFAAAAPTRILAAALLGHLADHQLTPESYVVNMLPRVFERLFGCQMTLNCFLNRLQHMLGGYVDGGREVVAGEGLPLGSDPRRCAETLVVFLRNWSDLVMACEDEDQAKQRKQEEQRKEEEHQKQLALSRGGRSDADCVIQKMMSTGHSKEDVIDLLEGAKELPGHVLELSSESDQRYHVSHEMVRRWELLSGWFLDDAEGLTPTCRNLGPYIHLRLDQPGEVNRVLGPIPTNTWTIVSPEVAAAATREYLAAAEGKSREVVRPKASLEQFAIKLADWKPECSPQGGGASSTFMTFFCQENRRVSRSSMQGLPPLPWSFGSDPRNTVVMDLPPHVAVAPFHCLFAKARAQPHRAVVMALGDPITPTHIVCPKFQPLQVRNGDRLVCHSWTFEVRLESCGTHRDALSLLSDEGTVFSVPFEGCHVGAGRNSRKLENQPYFPPAKFVLTHSLQDIAAVHVVFQYQGCMNRWTVVDHSLDPCGALLLLKPGIAYPVSEGLRLKVGPLILEVAQEPDPDSS